MWLKGNLIFFAFTALLAIILVLKEIYWFLVIFAVFIMWLKCIKKFNLKYLTLLFCILLLFVVRAIMEKEANITSVKPNQNVFTLYFTELLTVDGDQVTGIVQDKQTKEKFVMSYRFQTEQEKQEFEKSDYLGNICSVNAVLETPKKGSNPNSFNYQQYLYYQHIHWLIKLDNPPFATCGQQKSNLVLFLKELRKSGIELIERNFSEQSKAIAIALIFGSRDWMKEEIENAYQQIGVIHLLAISGSHIAILILIVYYLLIRTHITREASGTILLIILPIYAVLTGASPSVVRAVLTAMLFLLSRKWSVTRSLPSIYLLSFVFLLYLFVTPYVVFDVGFILSFAVCFSLLLSFSISKKLFRSIIWQTAFTSFVSDFIVTPILLFYFYEISTVSIVSNLIYIPLYSIIILPYVLVIFIFACVNPYVIKIFFYPLDYLLRFLDLFALKLSEHYWSTLILGKLPPFFLFLYLLSIPIYFFALEQCTKGKRILLLCIPLALLMSLFIFVPLHKEGEVTIIDVGQGDSIFIREPYNRAVYLIDTGGTITFEQEEWQKRNSKYEVGKDVVVPFLKSKGVRVLDKLVLTHADMDHIGGALNLIKSIKVKEILLPIGVSNAESLEEILQLAQKKNTQITFVKEGDYWKSSNIVYQVLSPNPAVITSSNNQSIVLTATLGGMKWLLTGDLEQEGELRLIKQYPTLKVDVLKIGHHGSATSTTQEFLEQLQPEVALISVGLNNRYGHPNKEVLSRLQQQNLLILRTDRHGAITYKFSGNTGTFYTHKP